MHWWLHDISKRLPRGFKVAALVISLVLSALFTVVAFRTPDLHWLGWIGFLPLFCVVRWLSPPAAALAGGWWGACLYVSCGIEQASAIDAVAPMLAVPSALAGGPSAWLLPLLILIPAAYLALAARRAQAINLRLLTLAIGWALIEAVLHVLTPCGPRDGLVASWSAEGPHLHWLTRLSSFVCTAFLVASAYASLLDVLSGLRLRLPALRSFDGMPIAGPRLLLQAVLPSQSWRTRRAHPRAPPVRTARMRPWDSPLRAMV